MQTLASDKARILIPPNLLCLLLFPLTGFWNPCLEKLRQVWHVNLKTVTPVFVTRKKAEQIKKSTTFLDPDPSVNWGHRANHCPQPQRDRQLRRMTAYWEQKPSAGQVPLENLNFNWQIAGSSMWTSLQIKNSKGIQPWIWGHTFEFTFKSPPGSQGEDQRKIPSRFR